MDTPSSTSDPSSQQANAVFNAGHGSNFLVQGGQFAQSNHTQNIQHYYEADDGFKHLQAHVAPAAYASQQEGDAPKCHPHTRTAVLDDIMTWILLTTTRIQWILWLHGAAGAGKSAIARSIVDLCISQQILIARFFFFRTDSTRNNLKPVVATLAYQLIQLMPDLNAIITPKIRSDPLIFSQSLETQFQTLIFEPLRQLHLESPFQKALVILVDGVDECIGDQNQTNLIRTFVQCVETKAFPLIVLFSSRMEIQLQMTFNSPKMTNILLRVPLDDNYLPDKDILLFLNESFSEIIATHPFGQHLDRDWPTPALVQEIVDKSSGQFIYASVVIKFLSMPRLHPAQQLEIVRGLRPSGSLTPFAQLDALYRHIFSQVQDIARATPILAYLILSSIHETRRCKDMLDMSNADISISLADLTSVIRSDNDNIQFLHASLPDFLIDRTRSQEYHIDKTVWSTWLSYIFLQKVVTSKSRRDIRFFDFINYLKYAEPTPKLHGSIRLFHPNQLCPYGIHTWTQYLTTLQQLDFNDGGELYSQQLNIVTRHIANHHPEYISTLKDKHEIAHILLEIGCEHEESQTQAQAREKQKDGKREAGQHDAVQEQLNASISNEQNEATTLDVKDVGQQEEDKQGDVKQTVVRSNGQDSEKKGTKIPKSSSSERLKSKLLRLFRK